MALLPHHQIQELCHFCRLSDKEIRSDLILGLIASENDYTSNFTGALRRNINSYSQTGLRATSYVLPPHEEKATGCDAAIIICNGGVGKILLIEGKWPRLSMAGHKWDWKQTSSGLSHYSDQLNRQSNHIHRYAIAEMFYDEHPFGSSPSYMQPNGSACLWHRDAVAFDSSRPGSPNVWSQTELISMLSTGTHDISHIVEQVCLCVEGVRMGLPDVPRFDILDYPLPSNLLLVTASEI